MDLGAVPEAAELKLDGRKLAYVTHYKKDENIILILTVPLRFRQKSTVHVLKVNVYK